MDGAGGHDGRRTVDGDPDLVALAAELTADEAARERSRAHWLAQVAATEGTLAGVLDDLAERGRPVLVHLRNGRLHRGVVAGVGADFAVLRGAGGRDVMVALAAVASVRTLPGEAPTLGDRFRAPATGMAEMLAALGDERARVMVTGEDARQSIVGELRAVGRDVLTIRGDGGTAYVVLASVAEISLLESG